MSKQKKHLRITEVRINFKLGFPYLIKIEVKVSMKLIWHKPKEWGLASSSLVYSLPQIEITMDWKKILIGSLSHTKEQHGDEVSHTLDGNIGLIPVAVVVGVIVWLCVR